MAIAKPVKGPRLARHDEVAGGWHWRIQTEAGPVHVWRPGRYEARSAGMVIYVHGLFTTVDEAFRAQKLPEQFAESRQNALFIVPEAPAAGSDPPNWNSLSALLSAVFARTHLTPPHGPLVVMGHSGAYRTIAPWLIDKGLMKCSGQAAIAEVILIDALYGDEDDYFNWLSGGPGRMTLVARGTTKWTEPFVKRFKHVAVRDDIPEHFDGFSKRERTAKLLYLRSQYGHMELITEGNTVPLLLRRTALRRCGDRVPKRIARAPAP